MQRPYAIEPVEWDVVYPIHVDPIGRIRRRGGAFQAQLAGDPLGAYPSGDTAVEAIWQGYLTAHRTQHEAAAVTHGGADRHPGAAAPSAPNRPQTG